MLKPRMTHESRYSTGEVAQHLNVTKERIRHYVQLGLLTPIICAHNNYWRFSTKDVQVLRLILKLRDLRFPLASIQMLLQNPSSGQAVFSQHLQQLFAEQHSLNAVVHSVQSAQKSFGQMESFTLEQLMETLE